MLISYRTRYNKKNKRLFQDAQVHEVIENAKEAKQVAEHTSKEHLKSKSGIIVEGLMIWQFVFRMLHPVPGEKLIGFVTRCRGCVNSPSPDW